LKPTIFHLDTLITSCFSHFRMAPNSFDTMNETLCKMIPQLPNVSNLTNKAKQWPHEDENGAQNDYLLGMAASMLLESSNGGSRAQQRFNQEPAAPEVIISQMLTELAGDLFGDDDIFDSTEIEEPLPLWQENTFTRNTIQQQHHQSVQSRSSLFESTFNQKLTHGSVTAPSRCVAESQPATAPAIVTPPPSKNKRESEPMLVDPPAFSLSKKQGTFGPRTLLPESSDGGVRAQRRFNQEPAAPEVIIAQALTELAGDLFDDDDIFDSTEIEEPLPLGQENTFTRNTIQQQHHQSVQSRSSLFESTFNQILTHESVTAPSRCVAKSQPAAASAIVTPPPSKNKREAEYMLDPPAFSLSKKQGTFGPRTLLPESSNGGVRAQQRFNERAARTEEITPQALFAELAGDLFDDNLFNSTDFEPIPLRQGNAINRNTLQQQHYQSLQSGSSFLESTLNQILTYESGVTRTPSGHLVMSQPAAALAVVTPPPFKNKRGFEPMDPPAFSLSKKKRTEVVEDAARPFRPYQEEQWSEKFEELCEFKKNKGHCFVPHTYTANPALARWVTRQRYQYKLRKVGKQSTMTDQRVTALEDHCFIWDSHGVAWQQRWNELCEYKKDSGGHCNVPSNSPSHPQLATWVKCQRRQYTLYWDGKISNMTLGRITELEKLGFEWQLRGSKNAA
jgi:hypothetical protein